MQYRGSYTHSVRHGCAVIPKGFVGENEMYWYKCIDTSKPEGKQIYYLFSENCEQVDINGDSTVVHKERMKLDKNRRWRLPDDILDYISGGDITFVGCFDFVHIIGDEERNTSYENIGDMTDFLKELLQE